MDGLITCRAHDGAIPGAGIYSVGEPSESWLESDESLLTQHDTL